LIDESAVGGRHDLMFCVSRLARFDLKQEVAKETHLDWCDQSIAMMFFD
jgi:hypothetical protein